jgi:molybdopterin-guanine dinucleotide biosynthesis protein
MQKKRAHIFAFAGKGGSGKTTLAGLLVPFLKEHELKNSRWASHVTKQTIRAWAVCTSLLALLPKPN